MRRTSGISLMLLIFLSLSLIIFSLLSLSGAVADRTLSTQAADRTTEYYAAVTEANNLISQIDAELAKCLREAEAQTERLTETGTNADSSSAKTETNTNGSSAKTETSTDGSSAKTESSMDGSPAETLFLQRCGQITESFPGVTWNDGTLSFSVDVDENQILQVEAEVSWPSSDQDPLYHIRTWKVVNTGDWTADNHMNLFRMEH